MEDNKTHGRDISLNDILDEYTPRTSEHSVEDKDIDKILSEATGEFQPVRPPRRPPVRPSESDRPEISFAPGRSAAKPSADAAAEIRSLANSMPKPPRREAAAPRQETVTPDHEPVRTPASAAAQPEPAPAVREPEPVIQQYKAPEPEIYEEAAYTEDSYIPDEQPVRTEPLPYRQNEHSRGAMFTMRTTDDDNRKKAATTQSEYIRRGDEPLILDQIQKLRSALTVRSAVLLAASVFSLFITIANDLKLPLAPVFDRTVNPAAFIFTNTILGIVAIGMSYSVITLGIKNLFRLSPDSDSPAALALLTAVISGLVMLFDPEPMKAGFFHVYTSAALLGMLFNTLGKLSVIHRTQRNFEFISKNKNISAVQTVSDPDTAAYITNGSSGGKRDLAVMRETDFVRDFMKNSYSSDIADLFAEKTTMIMLIAAVVVGVLSLIFDKHAENTLQKVFVLLAAMSGTLSLTTSFALALVANLPLMQASKRALGFSGVILGYSSIEEFGDVNSVLIDAEELFPIGTTEFTNLKMLGSYTIDKAIIYAASAARAGGSITQPAFYKMLRGETEHLLPADSVRIENGLGMVCRINGERVMLGSRTQMEKHGIDGLPPESAEDRFSTGNKILYLSVSGHAMMMFAVKIKANRSSRRWVQRLEDERISMYVRCSDGFIDRRLIASVYDLDPASVNILPPEMCADYDRLTAHEPEISSSMLCSGHLPTLSMLLSASKRVKASANMGVAIQYGAMILGILISVLMMLGGAFKQITPTITILYELSFLILTLIMQRINRV